MNGPNCPVHHTPMAWLSTTNEWKFYCPQCDRRYNEQFEPMPTDSGKVGGGVG